MDVAESVGVGVDYRSDQFKPFKERVAGGVFASSRKEPLIPRHRKCLLGKY